MDAALRSVSTILDLNTRLFVNCLAGVDDTSGLKRLDSVTNNMTFIAAHLLDARHFLARLLGVTVANLPTESLRDVQSVEEAHDLPKLEELRDGWRQVSKSLMDRLNTVSDEELRKKSDSSFPVQDSTVFGAISFLAQHESYHLGQLGFLRKRLGFDPMSYGELEPSDNERVGNSA